MSGDVQREDVLGSITDEFVCSPECPTCLGDGIVCENHPDQAWRPDADDACCGGAGMPCPSIAKARAVYFGRHFTEGQS